MSQKVTELYNCVLLNSAVLMMRPSITATPGGR